MFKRDELRDFYKKFYDENDNAHKIDHADEVVDAALHIVRELQLPLNKNIVMLTAYLHDIYRGVSKKGHHIMAFKYVMEEKHDPFLQYYHSSIRYTIAKACLEHRGSFKGEFSSLLSEVISAADRGKFTVESAIKRSYKYHMSSAHASGGDPIENVYNHVKNKYGTKGYARFPSLYSKVYDLDTARKHIDELTINDVREVIEREAWDV